ncbi:MAG: alpha/beta fold family hydrolase [Ramlibacter sp.]|nr:alpha/beta fold family hydrolase [Ramlibacter sp.]
MDESALEVPTSWGKLSGTLAWPEGAGPCTAALLIAGSGPTDRDGNNPLLAEPVDSLKRLAQALAGLGIASLRYDKRGIGGSAYPGLSEEALRFDDMVADAVLLAQRLAREPRVEHVVLVGHSEGALIAALAASAAGARGELEAQRRVEDVPDALVLLFRPSVQPYLMSWFRHDPAAIVGALAEPLLLVHGAGDTQVTADHARWLHDARPDARLRIVEGMDHLLAVGGDVGQGAHAVAGEVADWLQELDARVPA